MTNLSYVVGEFESQMEIMYRNNITLNFFKYVHQYVNCFFLTYEVKRLTRKEFKNLTNEEKSNYLEKKKIEDNKNKRIRSEIMKVKDDLCENREKYLSDPKYHSWIDKHKSIIFPKLEKKGLSYEDDIKINI